MGISENNETAASSKKGKEKNLGILTLAMFAAGIIMMAWSGHLIKKSSATDSWPATTGKIISSSVGQKTYRDTDHRTKVTYYPKVKYEYMITGMQYTSYRINYGDENTSGMKWLAQRSVDRYPSGKKVAVHYDPQNPAYAVLETGITGSSILIFLMGVVFFAAGVLCFRAYLKNR